MKLTPEMRAGSSSVLRGQIGDGDDRTGEWVYALVLGLAFVNEARRAVLGACRGLSVMIMLRHPVKGLSAKDRSYLALATALAESPAKPSVDSQGYVSDWRHNLVPSIDQQGIAQIEDDIGAGGGNELAKKLRAAHSSAALAANSFVKWLDDPTFSLVGHSGFNDCQLERKFPTGLQGQPPNLDLAAESPTHLVAAESKCTEYLTPKPPRFESSYDARVPALAHPSWQERFSELKSSSTLTRLDTAQLFKHYLGLRRYLSDRTQSSLSAATLVYLYWLPDNWDDCGLDDFSSHRQEAESFGTGLEDPTVDFTAMSYLDLWDAWEGLAAPPAWLPSLLGELRQRYAVNV